MINYDNYLHSCDFYEYTHNKLLYEEAWQSLCESNLNIDDINAAIRFCQIEFINDKCGHKLQHSDIMTIQNWKSIRINEVEILNNVLRSYKDYWGDVLDSYIRLSARKSRIKYLINNLSEILTNENINKYPSVVNQIKLLKEEYTSLLEQSK